MKRWSGFGLILVLAAILAAPASALGQGGGGGGKPPKGGGKRDPNALDAADEDRKKQKEDVRPKAEAGDIEALKTLVAGLKHVHQFMRDDAWQFLLKIDNEKCLDWLIGDGLKDGEPKVRADLIEIFLIKRLKKAVPALLKLMKSDKENKQLIIAALGAIGEPSAAGEILPETKKGKDPRTRAEAIEALVRLDKEAGIDAAKAGTSTAEWEVRVAAMRALASADENAAFEAVLGNLKDRRADLEKKRKSEWQPAYMAIRVLLAVEQRSARAEGLRDATDQLVALIKLERGRMKHEVGEALRAMYGKSDMDDDALWGEWWSVVRGKQEFKDGAVRPLYGEPTAAPPEKKGGKKGGKKGEKEEGEPPANGGGAAAGGGAVGTGVRFHGIAIWSDRVSFVVDCSGSMDGEMEVPEGGEGTGERKGEQIKRKKLEVSKDELVKTISSLPEDMAFNVGWFSTAATLWSKKLVPASKPAKAAATEFAQKLAVHGRTNYFAAIDLPLGDPDVDTVFFLTDGGNATDGRYIDQRRIVRNLHLENKFKLIEINCLLFGARAGGAAERWMEDLSAESGGRFYIRPEPK